MAHASRANTSHNDTWERLTATSPVLSRKGEALNDRKTPKETGMPAAIREAAERLATQRWQSVTVFRLKSGTYRAVTEDDQYHLAYYGKRAVNVGVVAPKLPSVASLVRAMPSHIREEGKHIARKTGQGVVIFYRRNGNYAAVTVDDEIQLARHRSHKYMRELLTIAPPAAKTGTTKPASAPPTEPAPGKRSRRTKTAPRTAVKPTRATPAPTETERATVEPEVSTEVQSDETTRRKRRPRAKAAKTMTTRTSPTTSAPEEVIPYDRRRAQFAYYLHHLYRQARKFVTSEGTAFGWDTQPLRIEVGPRKHLVDVVDPDQLSLTRHSLPLPFDGTSHGEPIVLAVRDGDGRTYTIADTTGNMAAGFLKLVNDVQAHLVMPPKRVSIDVFDVQYFGFWNSLKRFKEIAWDMYEAQHRAFLKAAGSHGYDIPNVKTLLPPISSNMALFDNVNTVIAFADGTEARYRAAHHMEAFEVLDDDILQYLVALREDGLQPLHGMRDEPVFNPLVRTGDILVYFTDAGREYYRAEVDGDPREGARVVAHPVSPDLESYGDEYDIDLNGNPWEGSLWAFMPMSEDRDTDGDREEEDEVIEAPEQPARKAKREKPAPKKRGAVIDVIESPDRVAERNLDLAESKLDKLEELLSKAIILPSEPPQS